MGFGIRELRRQAVFRRRRHQPKRPPPAKIRPGSPAPAIGVGTPTVTSQLPIVIASSKAMIGPSANTFGPGGRNMGIGKLGGPGGETPSSSLHSGDFTGGISAKPLRDAAHISL